MEIFHFCIFLFSQLWTPFLRKLMKRPAVFVTYFQSPFQVPHVKQVLPSEYFFQKSVDCFNFMPVFLNLNHFSWKNYDKIYRFCHIFWMFLSFCTFSQTLAIWIILQKMLLLFENVNKLLLISVTLSIVCHETYEKTYRFYGIFWKFLSAYTRWQNFVISKLLQWNLPLFQNVNNYSFS